MIICMINEIRNGSRNILVVGLHKPIIQSVLDFDYLSGKTEPSIVAIISNSGSVFKCFFGSNEILIPIYSSISEASFSQAKADFLLNLISANNVLKTTEEFFDNYPQALGAHVFAEGFREQDAVRLIRKFGKQKRIAGGSGVGLLVPGGLKLGAIGGIYGGDIDKINITKCKGNVAIICSSGGMVGELLNFLSLFENVPSLAVSYGGEIFPVTSPLEWCLEAQKDPDTDEIIYFGELGGFDEYEVAAAIKSGVLSKPLHVYIAGHYKNDNESIQFGHAKALAKNPSENADAKMEVLKTSGALVYKTYEDFLSGISKINFKKIAIKNSRNWDEVLKLRRHSLFTTVRDRGNADDPFVKHILCTLLEQDNISKELVMFSEKVFSSLTDHGAEPSGPVNTMITARAGKDMSASVAAGILTIGNRFGGAINAAAKNWYEVVTSNSDVDTMLSKYKEQKKYVPGIGHKKYSLYKNDPRVEALTIFFNSIAREGRFLRYAESVAKKTTQKKPSLILNIDGAVAAMLLDILVEYENFSDAKIKKLLAAEFFNSFFIIPRTVGLIGNFLSQKKYDEGLFRLSDDDVFYL